MLGDVTREAIEMDEPRMAKKDRKDQKIKKRTKVILVYFGQACLLDALKRNFGLGSKRSLKAPKVQDEGKYIAF